MTNIQQKTYHYRESGLDNIYLLNGFEYSHSPRGTQVTIKDIDGLHKAIGSILINQKKNLIGKELRFLRQEMLMSQYTLSRLLEVSEGTINRWENDKSPINKPAEHLIRMLYAEYIGEHENIRDALKKIADMEDELDRQLIELTLKETENGWRNAV